MHMRSHSRMYYYLRIVGLVCIVLSSSIHLIDDVNLFFIKLGNPRLRENIAMINREDVSYYSRTMESDVGHRGQPAVRENTRQVDGQHGYIGLDVRYENAPVNLTIKKGFFVDGSLVNLYKSDGKNIEIKSEQDNDSSVVIVYFDYRINVSGNFSIKVSFSENVTLFIKSYNASNTKFQIILNMTNITYLEKKFNIDNPYADHQKFCLCANASNDFYITIDYALYEPQYQDIVQMKYRFLSYQKLEYTLKINKIVRYTKVFLLNLSSYLSVVEVFPTNIIWNYSEKSVILKDDEDLRIRFIGHDYWTKTGFVNFSIELKCREEEIEPSEIRLMKKLRYFRFIADDESFYFAKKIVIRNPTKFDIYNVSLGIELNDSWFDMLKVGEDPFKVNFVDITHNESYNIHAFLNYWDGKTAIYSIKIPVIKAYEERIIEIRYGNSYLPTISQKEYVCKMGPVTAMENLSDKNMWHPIYGRVVGGYDNDFNESFLTILNGTLGKSFIYMKHNISGSLDIEFLVRTYSAYVIYDYYSMEFYPFYVDNDTYYVFKIRRISSNSLSLVLLFRNESFVDTIDSKTITVENPYGVKIEFLNNFSSGDAVLVITTDYDTFPFTYNISLDKYYSVSKEGWKIAFGASNISRTYVFFYFWSNRKIKKLWIRSNGEEKFFINGTVVNEYETDWELLNEKTLIVPSNVEVILRAYDIYNSSILEPVILNNISERGIAKISIDASILYLNNTGSISSEVEIWLNHSVKSIYVDAMELYRLVLAKKTYLLRFFDDKNRSYLSFIAVLSSNIHLLLGTWEKILGCINEKGNIGFVYSCIEDQDSEDVQDDIYYMAVNYSKIKSYFHSILNFFFGRIYQYWNTSRNNISDDFGRSISYILSDLNITEISNASLVNITYTGQNLRLLASDDKGELKIFLLNYTMDKVIDAMRRRLAGLYYLIELTQNIILSGQMGQVLIDKNDQKIILRFYVEGRRIDTVIDMRDGLLNINSTLLDISGTLISAFRLTLFASMLSNREILMIDESTRLSLTINMDEEEIDISLKDVIGAPSTIWLTFLSNSDYYAVKDNEGDILAVLNIEHNTIWGTNRTFDVEKIRFDVLFQKVFNGLILRTIEWKTHSNVSTIDWIQNNVVLRRLNIIDFYTGDKMQSLGLSESFYVRINGSIFSLNVFSSLRGILYIEVLDIWDTAIWSGSTRNETITIKLKLGALVILNDLDSDVVLNISPVDSIKWASWYICKKSIIGLFLIIDRRYNVAIIEAQNKSIIYRNEIEYNISGNINQRPLVVLFLSSDLVGSDNNIGEESFYKSQNSGGLKTLALWLFFTLSVIVVLGIATKKLVNRLKRSQVIPVEEIIEKMLEETDRENE